MGEPLVEILAERGHDVYVTTRSDRISGNGSIHYIMGNAQETDFLRRLLERRFNAVIDFMVYGTGQFEERMELLLSSTGQYVFFSSARVFADAGGAVITEDSARLLDTMEDKEYLETDEYALAKAREEDLLWHSGYGNWTIIRPYITYNRERLQLGVMEKEAWLQRALEGKSIVFSRDIANRYTTLTYGRDVSVRIAELIGNEDALGEVFNIATAQSVKWEAVLEIYLDVLERETGRRPKVYWQDDSGMLAGICRNQYRIKYDRLYNRRFGNAKIQEMAGAGMAFTPLEEGLRRCLEEFIRSGGKFRGRNWKLEGAFDRVTGERTRVFSIDGWKNKVKYILYRTFGGRGN